MAQVIKHQLGGNIQYQPFTPSIQTILDVRYNTQDILDYLKDTSKRKKYTNDYRGFTPQQTERFNKSLDSYIRGIEDGKIVFSEKGLTKLTNIDGVDPAIEPYVNEYLTSSIGSSLIPMYDESYKDVYKIDLNKVLSKSVLGEEVPSNVFLPAWGALDPINESTNIRGISNRRAAYAKALREEASRLENNSDYRNKYQFSGWESDLNAYKKAADLLKAHADAIEKVNDFNKEEQWIRSAAAIGLKKSDIVKLFFTNEEYSDSTPTANPADTTEPHEDGGFNFQGSLSKEDPAGYYENKHYTIDDDYENLPDKLKEAALEILNLYDRKQIQGDWLYWSKYQNKYLENLTPQFSNDRVLVYSVSNGPLSNKGKKFFIRRLEDKYPIEVSIDKNQDGTYSAHNSNLNINLGQYTESKEAIAARTYDRFKDLGKPIAFNLPEVIKSTESINDFFNQLIQFNTKHMNPKMFSHILVYLSAWLYAQPDAIEYTQWRRNGGANLHGSSFEVRGSSFNSPTAFIWKFRNYGIKFDFTGPNKYINLGRNNKALDPSKIKAVTIDYASKLKLGGKLRMFQEGGVSDYLEYQKKYGLNLPIETSHPKNKPKEEKKEDDKYKELIVQGEPTTADKIRFVAATTDLLSSFLTFPKGTNIAAMAGTGLSFLGYVTADVMDIVNDKLPAADTLLNDAKLAALMAFPLFINPTKAKALGAGERMQKLVGMATRYVGTAFALGQLTDKKTVDDIINSWNKVVTNPTKMDAHDLTNIAFTLRLVAGGKEHVKRIKNNRQYKQIKKENETGEVEYKIKQGETETSNLKLKVKRGEDLSKESIIQRILKKHEDLNLKEDEVTILTTPDKNIFAKLRNQWKKENNPLGIKFNESKTTNPNLEQTDWVPTRAFQRATLENGAVKRTNTSFGEFIRRQLGPNWDLVYSDYRLVNGYRLGKINQLNKGLYTSLDLLRKQGEQLERIRNEQTTGETKRQLFLRKMSEFGYNITDEDAAVAKANELADLYVSDLSKYDNLQIAQMMYDKDRELGLFGEKPTQRTTTPEASGETPAPDVPTSKFNPEGLKYKETEELTPELLQEAYIKFLQDKQFQPTEENPGSVYGQIVNTESRRETERRNLVSKIFQTFNIDDTRVLMQTQEQLYRKLRRLPETKKFFKNNLVMKPEDLQKLLKVLRDKKQISETDYQILSSFDGTIPTDHPSYELLQRLNGTGESNKRVKYGVRGVTDEKLKDIASLIIDQLSEENRPFGVGALTLKLQLMKLLDANKISETVYDAIMSTQNATEGDMFYKKLIDEVNSQVRTHKAGGRIRHEVLYAQGGSSIYPNGITTNENFNWYDQIFSPSVKSLTEEIKKILTNEGGQYNDFLGFGPDSWYQSQRDYDVMHNAYKGATPGSYYRDEEGTAKRRQELIYQYFPSLVDQGTNQAYGSGQFNRRGENTSGTYHEANTPFEGDNMFSAITDQWHLGNPADMSDTQRASWYKWLSDIESEFSSKYKLYFTEQGSPVFIDINTSDEDIQKYNLKSLKDQVGDLDLSSVTNPVTGNTGNTDKTDTKPEDLADVKPLPPDWWAQLPKDNLTTARLLNTLFGNAATFAIRNKYKPLFTKDQTYLDFKRVFRDTSAIDSTNRLYGQFLSKQAGVSADMRQNMAASNDLMSKYATAMETAEQQNKTVFDTTSKDAQDAAKNNSLNLTNTYNANIKKYTDEQALQQKYSAGALKQASENISNLFTALIQEKGNDRLYARQHYLNSQLEYLSQLNSQNIQNIQRHYYDIYKSHGGDASETVDTFATSTSFKNMNNGAFYDDYLKKIQAAQRADRINKQRLYAALFSTDLFGNPSQYDIDSGEYGNQDSTGISKSTTEAKKQGGKISMAKQGGASVNWVRVENARMINKQVNTAMKETYKSLRQANAELQKTIRAMEPLIRKLNRRDSVKLQ